MEKIKEAVNTGVKLNFGDKRAAAKGGRATKGFSKRAKQEKLAEVFVDNLKGNKKLTKKEMMLAAGYSLNTVSVKQREVWNTKGLQEALARRGFTQDKMIKVLDEAANAGVVTTYRGDAKETDAPDHAIRLRAIDQLADVLGMKKLTVAQLNVDVNMQGDDLKTLLDI